jgi:hypothetical protein
MSEFVQGQAKPADGYSLDEAQKIIGRIAAFYNQKDFLPNREENQGAVDFLNVSNSQEAADAV